MITPRAPSSSVAKHRAEVQGWCGRAGPLRQPQQGEGQSVTCKHPQPGLLETKEGKSTTKHCWACSAESCLPALPVSLPPLQAPQGGGEAQCLQSQAASSAPCPRPAASITPGPGTPQGYHCTGWGHMPAPHQLNSQQLPQQPPFSELTPARGPREP